MHIEYRKKNEGSLDNLYQSEELLPYPILKDVSICRKFQYSLYCEVFFFYYYSLLTGL